MLKTVSILTLASALLSINISATCVHSGDGTAYLISAPGRNKSFVWETPHRFTTNSLGSIVIPSSATGTGSNWKIDLNLKPTSKNLVVKELACSESRGGPAFVVAYLEGERSRTVRLAFSGATPSSLTIDVTSEDLSVSEFSLDRLPPELSNNQILVPYFSKIYYSPESERFAEFSLDWQNSNATRLGSTVAEYEPLTDGRRRTIREKVVLKLSARVDEVLPYIHNPPSEFLSSVAGKIVLDVWSPTFSTISTVLTQLKLAGLKNCVIIVHDWTGKGYDSGYPDHVPASLGMGGETELRNLASQAKEYGCYIALHENYNDYYPNYSLFKNSDISISSKAELETGWLNPTTNVQAYVAKPSSMARIAETQSAEIHRRYGTNASYVDVASSMVPWWQVDMDALVQAGGMFRANIEAYANLWAIHRRIFRGPVFGEGDNHWYWSGLLDGVEAQILRGAREGKNFSKTGPLFVDFDLLRIHPLQVNHGMGYYERWLDKTESIFQTSLEDAYRMQEVAFGHAPFLSKGLWNSTYHVMQEQNIVGPVASRYGTAKVKRIRYQVNGEWTTSEEAVKYRDWDRVLVQYSNGDTIVVNSRAKELEYDSIVLPQFGWVAKGPGLLAYTALRNGLVVDYSDTGDEVFANARNQSDINASLKASRAYSPAVYGHPDSPDTRVNATGAVIDFGPIKTDGMISINKSGGGWNLTVYPSTRNVMVELSSKRFPAAKSVVCDASENSPQHPDIEGGFWRIDSHASRTCSWK